MTYLCLALCTIIEPVFESKVRRFFRRVCKKDTKKRVTTEAKKGLEEPLKKTNTLKSPLKKPETPGNQDGSGGSDNEASCSMAFQPESNKNTNSDSSDDFENGDNLKDANGTEMDIIDRSKFEKEVKESYNNFDEKFKSMSIKQKTNYFVRNIG